MSDLDINVGDLVQIRPQATINAGEIGRVIGIKAIKGRSELSMTVMFSDNTSTTYYPCQLTLLRSVKPANGKQEVRYEKR